MVEPHGAGRYIRHVVSTDTRGYAVSNNMEDRVGGRAYAVEPPQFSAIACARRL